MLTEIALDRPSLQRYLRYIEAKPKQVDRASHTAMKRTLKWGASALVRGLSQQHDIPGKVIRGKSSNPHNAGKKNADRIRVRNPSYMEINPKGYLWVGSKPIAAGYIGRLRQLKRGAKTRSHMFTGAFVAEMKSGHQGIFQRDGQERLGINQHYVQLHEADQVVAYVKRNLPLKLRAQMDQQMRFQVDVRG